MSTTSEFALRCVAVSLPALADSIRSLLCTFHGLACTLLIAKGLGLAGWDETQYTRWCTIHWPTCPDEEGGLWASTQTKLGLLSPVLLQDGQHGPKKHLCSRPDALNR